MQSDFVNQFIDQFNSRFGPGLDTLSGEMRQQVRTAAMAAFSRMELVTREEFETQQTVLQRTRQKLEALEAQVTAMEQALAKAADS